MKFHPYAEVFPLLEGAALDELAADIKASGLWEPIWTYEGKILDGRNRYLACKKAGVEPDYREFKGSAIHALGLVVSANIQRRQLTPSQRASAAAKIAAFRHGGDRRSDQAANLPLETQSSAAEKFDVSERSVRAAHKVHEKGSKALNEALDSGEISVSKAAAVTILPKSEQLKAATAKPDYIEDDCGPDANEDALLALAAKEREASLEKVLAADDRLAAAAAEIKRQAAEIAALKISRDGFMNGKAAVEKLLAAANRKIDRLEKRLEQAA